MQKLFSRTLFFFLLETIFSFMYPIKPVTTNFQYSTAPFIRNCFLELSHLKYAISGENNFRVKFFEELHLTSIE